MRTASGDTGAFLEFLYLLEGGKKLVAIGDDTIQIMYQYEDLQDSGIKPPFGGGLVSECLT